MLKTKLVGHCAASVFYLTANCMPATLQLFKKASFLTAWSVIFGTFVEIVRQTIGYANNKSFKQKLLRRAKPWNGDISYPLGFYPGVDFLTP